jgi:hypothetical protein
MKDSTIFFVRQRPPPLFPSSCVVAIVGARRSFGLIRWPFDVGLFFLFSGKKNRCHFSPHRPFLATADDNQFIFFLA